MNNFFMANNETYEMIGRMLTNCTIESDQEVFEAWLNESPENQQLFDSLRDNWVNSPLKKYQIIGSEEIKASIWERSLNDRNKQIHKTLNFKWKWWYSLAATISLILVSLFIFNDFLPKKISVAKEVVMVNKENGAGRKSTIFLKDGTIVYLNAESQINYPDVFSDTARVVQLEGEAFFDVARDEQKPFIVVIQQLAVEALGTSFNVSAYQELDEIKVSLAEGKVIVQLIPEINMTNQQHVLESGQEILYNRDKNSFSDLKFFNRKKVLGWKEGILSFESADLTMLIKQLERWYGVEIKVANSNVPNMSYTGEFHNQSLQNVLESVGFVQNFTYEINGNNVIIMFNK